ncbi:MAG: hypothetical protein ACLU8D_10355 [Enterocloster sp.]
MIGGLDEISSGSLFIDGKDMTDADPRTGILPCCLKQCAVSGHDGGR